MFEACRRQYDKSDNIFYAAVTSDDPGWRKEPKEMIACCADFSLPLLSASGLHAQTKK